MKKVAVIILTLALVLGMVLPASAVSAADASTIVIHKVILDGGPDEVFTFNVYRDFNNNGILDFVPPWPDEWVGDVVIDTSVTDTGSIVVPWLGPYVIHETLQPPSVYLQPADEAVYSVSHGATVYFYNKPGEVPERGQLEILKVDEAGAALVGAEFLITPNPKTGADSLILIDNGLNDENPADGALLVTDCIIGTVCEVKETKAPDGYVPAPPQTVTISATVTLTFENYPERGQLEILKNDENGEALYGATFVITPDPKTGSGSLTVVDNGLNDEDATDGVLLVTGCIIGTVCEVKETKAPDGYDLAPPQTVTISAMVTVDFQNFPEDGDATRTPGFWMTHCDFTQHVFFEHLGGSINLGWRVLDSPAYVFGMFWANTAYEYNSDGSKRSKLCQAKVIGSFQLTAAILNTGLDNGASVPIDPVTGLDLITAMQNALSGKSRGQILRLSGLLDTYNNSGDDIDIVDDDGYPVLPADPKCAKALADVTIADCD